MLKMYKIGIEIAALNSAGPVFAMLSKDLLGLGNQAKYVTGQMGALKLAAIGAGAALAGGAVLKGVWALAQYGNQLANVQSRLRQMGVSAANVGAMSNAAFAASQQTPNVTWSDSLAALTKGRTVLGSSAEAIQAAPVIVRAEGILDNWGMGGPTALGQLLKAIELRGGTYGPDGKTFSVAALSKNLKYAEEAQNLAGKLLTPAQIMNATKYAGPAAQMMSTFAWWSSMAEAVQQMGPTGGRGFGMAMKALSGGPISRMNAHFLEQYGLVGADGFVKIPHTFQTAIKPGALRGSKELYSKGLFAWTKDVLVPSLESHGVHGKQAILAAVYQTISSQTGSRLIANMITNSLSYTRTAAQMNQAGSVDVFGIQMSTSMTGPLNALSGAFTTFLQTVGSPLVPVAISVINALTNTFTGMSQWAKLHPERVKLIVESIADLGAALVVFGSAAVILALASLGGAPALIAGAITALVAGIALLINNFEDFVNVLKPNKILQHKKTGNLWLDDPTTAAGNDIGAAGRAIAHFFGGNGGHWVPGPLGSTSWEPGPAQTVNLSPGSVHAIAHAIKTGLTGAVAMHQGHPRAGHGTQSRLGFPGTAGLPAP